MQYIKAWLSIIVIVITPVITGYTARAASSSVVISQVQTGGAGTGTAGQEFIEIYNNSDVDVDITGWCITYSSSSDATQQTIGCITQPNSSTAIWLKAKSYLTYVSPDYKQVSGFGGDGTFSYVNGIASTAGHVRILDSTKHEVDKLAWGTNSTPALHPEAIQAAPPAGGKSLQRVVSSGSKDTDNNSIDFVVTSPTLHQSGLYEVVTIIDVCANIAGVQQVIPAGMIIDISGSCVVPPPIDVCPNITGYQVTMPLGLLADSDGACQVDVCSNIAGLQVIVPNGYDRQSGGNCIEHDECDNIVGTQQSIPSGYLRQATNDCNLDLAPLQISELMPNVSGSDIGHEYVEIYNPTDHDVLMNNYILLTGINGEKSYTFPINTMITAKTYAIFHDDVMKFSLLNTASKVTLKAIDGTLVSQSDAYANPGDDKAWALIDGVWQYTDQPTPGAANVAALVDDSAFVTSVPKIAECSAGKYRNPLTNRCRSIESDATVLASCDADQYRNPETGRCRKLAVVAAVASCKDGQYRSEETNRCRNIATTSNALADCKEGQERNPDTNRCRNVAAKSVPNAAFAVESVKDGSKAFIGWWALGGVSLLAAGYAGWEWRREVSSWVKRVLHFGPSR